MIIVYNEYGKNLNQNIIRQVKILNEQTIQYIIENYTYESGVRKLKECLKKFKIYSTKIEYDQ